MRGESFESALAVSSACTLPTSITVLYYRSPFEPGTKREIQFEDDLTIEEIIDRIDRPEGFPWDLRVRIQGFPIAPDAWCETTPNPGTTVTIRAIPKGGNGSGKAALQIVLGIALIAFSIVTFGVGSGGALGGLSAIFNVPAVSAATAVQLAIGGAALIAAGAFSIANPPPAVPFSGEIPATESRAIQAAQNEVRPFAPVPRLFGRYRYYPPYAAKPYSEVVGNDQFLRLLFTPGYGPLQLEELRIGEDLVDNFDSVEWNFLPGYDDDPPLTIFTSSIDETPLNVDLEPMGLATLRTTEVDSHEASIDLTFPTGLIAFESKDGTPRGVASPFRVEFRQAGSSGPYTGVTPSQPLAPGLSNPAPGDILIEARDSGAIVRGMRWIFPSPGQWEIRITRAESIFETENLGSLVDKCFWTKLRSIRPGTAPRIPNLALLEMRIRATDQLAGIIQDLSGVFTSIVPVWNSVDGWGADNRHSSNLSLQPTRNAAWCLSEMLRGGVNARRVPDANIDHDSISSWAISNTAAGRNFDAIVDFDTTIGQVCRDIAGSSRASFNVIDGRYGVVVDERKPVIVAQFSSRDTSDFSATKAFRREIHGLRTRFISPEAGYEPEERIVYADGYDESNAFEFGDLDLWGVTDPDQAHAAARYQQASGKLRPEVYSFSTDIAHLAITRGDRIVYSNDVMLVGLGSARIVQIFTEVTGAVAIEIDEFITYDPEKEYAVRIRDGATGRPTLHPILNLNQVSEIIVFVNPVPDPADYPEVDEMVSWGESGQEVGDYIVHAIVPTTDLGARVEILDYSEEIFDIDDGPIPDFDPNITEPTPRQIQKPARPVIESVASDESVLVFNADGSYRVRILVSAALVQNNKVLANSIEAQYRSTEPLGDWKSAGQVNIRTPQISIENVDQGERYDIRIRSITVNGLASEWSTQNGHLVIGASTVPPDVINLRVDSGKTLVWDYPDPPRDLAGFLVRHQAGIETLWQSGIPAHGGIVTETLFDISTLPSGERTILVKAIDAAGIESTNAASVVKDIGFDPIENLVESEDFHAGGFAGTIENATVEGGTGDLVADTEADLFWRDPNDLFWGPAGDAFWGDSFKAMAYESEWTPAPGTAPGRLVLTHSISGTSPQLFYRESPSVFWLPWPGEIDAVDGITYQFRIEIPRWLGAGASVRFRRGRR